MKIAFYTLGCKVNQYETQALEQLLCGRGHTLVPFEESADAYIINTCTVTAVSDKKSRQVIRRTRKNAPDAIIAVCGCYPQTHPQDMEGLSIDLVSGTGDRQGFVELLFILSGKGKALYDGEYEPVYAGICHYCPMGHSHSLINDSDEDLVFCAVVPQHPVAP